MTGWDTRTHARTHARARARTHAHTHTHTHSHTHTHTHYTHTHTHTTHTHTENLNIFFITISFYVRFVVHKIDAGDGIYVILCNISSLANVLLNIYAINFV